MARIYANENFPFPAVAELRRLGHDVLTTHESGRAGQRISDAEMLAFAASERRILLTFNRRHFIRLHEESPTHCGIVVCTIDPDAAALAKRIDAAINVDSGLDGLLVRVNRPRS